MITILTGKVCNSDRSPYTVTQVESDCWPTVSVTDGQTSSGATALSGRTRWLGVGQCRTTGHCLRLPCDDHHITHRFRRVGFGFRHGQRGIIKIYPYNTLLNPYYSKTIFNHDQIKILNMYSVIYMKFQQGLNFF